MKKSFILAGLLVGLTATAQYEKRVGINTDKPRATLEVRTVPITDENKNKTKAQGILFPHISQEEKENWEADEDKGLVAGTVIWNTDKKCLDYFNGTTWICTDGTQKDVIVPKTEPITLPNVSLGNSMYWFSSIYDNDYLSISNGTPTIATPTGAASLAQLAADGIASGGTDEPVLNVQGKIPTEANAIEVYIPVTVNTAGTLPAFTTYVSIPAEYTTDGQGGIAVLSWPQMSLATNTTYFGAKIYAQNSEISLKQLDLIAGLGADHKGIYMTSFKYPATQAQSQGPASGWTATYDLRLISGIPDQHFNKKTEGAYRHRFIYAPVWGIDQKMWLNNNLGAYYAQVGHAEFNPGQQAKSPTDHNAYGSLGQWGRVFDGHELMNWTSGTQGTPVFTQTPYNWTSDMSSTLTEFNENCPTGWHTPTNAEHQTLTSATNAGSANITNKGHFVGGLRVPMSGNRSTSSGSNFNNVGGHLYLWSATLVDNGYSAHYMIGLAGVVNPIFNIYRSYGFPLRCLKY